MFKTDVASFRFSLNDAVTRRKLTMQNRKAIATLVELIEQRYAVKALVFVDSSEKRSQLKNIDLLIRKSMSAVLPEIDAFHDFKSRGHMDALPSWDVLAQMRHRSVPTRLLDWTESCNIALHFALKDYLAKLIKAWSKQEWHGTYPDFPNVDEFYTPQFGY